MNSHSNSRSLPKEEILDTVDMILDLLSDKEDYRPRMAEDINMQILKLKGDEIPEEIEDQLREHEAEMEMFMKAIETLCEESFPIEFNRLKEFHPDITKRILRNGEARSDLVLLRRKLEINESNTHHHR
jgi:hypothetical protein